MAFYFYELRRDSPVTNCDLFGHEKGAFIDANQQRAGRFEVAKHWTLFLDEIGDMPAETLEISGYMKGALGELRPCAMGFDSLEQHDRDTTSLAQAFAGVPKDVGLSSAVAFRVVVIGQEREFKAGLREDLFTFGREAILNAYRHSRAKHIETEIEYRSAELRIAIRDDGCGINVKRLLQSENRGLQGMCALAERIGARLRIFTKIARGTDIELCVPGPVAFEQSKVCGTAGIKLVNFARYVRDWIGKQ